VVRSPWDYIDHLDEFRAWIDRVAAAGTLWNPPPVLHWNLHKQYLLELQAAGAPIVPTVLLPRAAAASFDGLLDAQGWNAAVVKPAVSVGAIGAGRFDVGDAAGQAHLDGLLGSGDVLVQQYVPSVEHDGEVSVVLLDGEVTHAVRKRPAPGDYRIHPQYGGTATPIELTAGLVALTERLVRHAPGPVLYARADLVDVGETYAVMELEVVEPRLWLDGPGLVERFADAVLRRLDVAA
jgi:glutathione synthase/RimK-type ligase-like ATP-grasp enzyme